MAFVSNCSAIKLGEVRDYLTGYSEHSQSLVHRLICWETNPDLLTHQRGRVLMEWFWSFTGFQMTLRVIHAPTPTPQSRWHCRLRAILISHVGTIRFSPAWRTESSLSAGRSPWTPQMLRVGSRATVLKRQITISWPTVRTHFLSELADSQLWTPTNRNCICPLLCGTKHVAGSHQLLACRTQPWVHPRGLSTEQISFVSYKSPYPMLRLSGASQTLFSVQGCFWQNSHCGTLAWTDVHGCH